MAVAQQSQQVWFACGGALDSRAVLLLSLINMPDEPHGWKRSRLADRFHAHGWAFGIWHSSAACRSPNSLMLNLERCL
jgi:hypothetical protein